MRAAGTPAGWEGSARCEGWRAQSPAEEQRSCWWGRGALAPSRGRAPAAARGGDRSHQREPVSLVCGTSPQHTAQAVKQAIKWSDIFVVSVTLEIRAEFCVIKVTLRTGRSHPTSSVHILVYQMGRQLLGDFLAVLSKCEISWQINPPPPARRFLGRAALGAQLRSRPPHHAGTAPATCSSLALPGAGLSPTSTRSF